MTEPGDPERRYDLDRSKVRLWGRDHTVSRLISGAICLVLAAVLALFGGWLFAVLLVLAAVIQFVA